jgi:hypothetical protein
VTTIALRAIPRRLNLEGLALAAPGTRAHQPVSLIECLSKVTRRRHLPRARVGSTGLDQQVEMIRHQHVRMQKPSILADCALQQPEELNAIVIIEVDVTPFDSPVVYVPESARIFQAQRTSHCPSEREELDRSRGRAQRGAAMVPRIARMGH